jgi:hypothetical protein
VLLYCRIPVRFGLGLRSTEFLSCVVYSLGPIAAYITLFVVLGIVAGVALLGWKAYRFQAWAFIALLALIGIDTLMVLLFSGFSQILPVLVHALAMYSLLAGLMASRIYSERVKNGQA